MDKVHDINNFLEKDGKFDLYNSFFNWLCPGWPNSNIVSCVYSAVKLDMKEQAYAVFSWFNSLTHCSLVTLYGDTDQGQSVKIRWWNEA